MMPEPNCEDAVDDPGEPVTPGIHPGLVVVSWILFAAIGGGGGYAISSSIAGNRLDQLSADYRESSERARKDYNSELTAMKNRAARAGMGRWRVNTHWQAEPSVEFEWGHFDPTKPGEPYLKDCVIDAEGPPGITIRSGGTMQGCSISGVPIVIGGETK